MLRKLLVQKFRYLSFEFYICQLSRYGRTLCLLVSHCVLMLTVYEKLHTLELGIQGLLQMA